jgi:tRNA (uracil-5-)-methyltransferase
MNFRNAKTVEDLEILDVNSNGHGMAVMTPSAAADEDEDRHDHQALQDSKVVVIVPFVTKGDVIRAKVGVHHKWYAEGHLLEVIHPSVSRRDELVRCSHFGVCGGCQLQMIPYNDQLSFKKKVVVNAFEKYGFDVEELPISDTVASPLEYEYRSKLTPHFNSNRADITIGFDKSGMGRGMFDVESCEIATPVISNALTQDRENLETIVKRYKKSGTILLRDKSIDGEVAYTTDHKEVIAQKINGYVFRFPAGEFFQNNSSILPLLINDISGYLKELELINLVDTYCGSGFIGISLSKHIKKLIGIEISAGNLKMASMNAQLNGLHNSQYILGSSEEIFKDLDPSVINPNETCIVLDPSRKGSSHSYLTQLSQFKPKLIVYVSCNVFTQARDLQYFLHETANGAEYEIRTVKGYDFFPQTKHVESLVVLQLR